MASWTFCQWPYQSDNPSINQWAVLNEEDGRFLTHWTGCSRSTQHALPVTRMQTNWTPFIRQQLSGWGRPSQPLQHSNSGISETCFTSACEVGDLGRNSMEPSLFQGRSPSVGQEIHHSVFIWRCSQYFGLLTSNDRAECEMERMWDEVVVDYMLNYPRISWRHWATPPRALFNITDVEMLTDNVPYTSYKS